MGLLSWRYSEGVMGLLRRRFIEGALGLVSNLLLST